MKNTKKKLILGTIISGLGLMAYNTFALPKKEITYLDNRFVQTYEGRDGIWMIPSNNKNAIANLLEETGSSLETLLTVNNIPNEKKIPKTIPIFFPYSDSKLAELEADGKGREAISSDPEKLVWPVIADKYSKITSRIGRRWNKFHTGIDIACVRNTIIVAAADGEVQEAGWMGHYGKIVKIYHKQLSNTETIYAHNTHVLVKKGDHVKKGQIIAFSGTTGKSTGPHLHFEVRYQNIFLNPEHFLPEFPDTIEAIAQLD
ncbi:M23 family metallopeptidase [Leptospira sp. GIMC2001]|uniref:M23 family metallopeptidase n=1 Tax=Leptospira sp. GIMC2001 TaxID=1513297 RepID=UPI0023492450|nr:M23 family metallopeptidase [Leptospira sp. GIMC2001]WCL48490.1 M23 family metallopeptidase [Leptospira sp. GIMC2001]